MTRISSAEVQRNFADILERVSEKGEHFEIDKDGTVIARLEPMKPKTSTVGDLREWLANHSRLDPEDAEQWEKELAEIRASAKSPPSPWD